MKLKSFQGSPNSPSDSLYSRFEEGAAANPPSQIGLQQPLHALCGRRDLNPYPLLDTPLKRARMPIPPRPQISKRYYTD